MSKKICFSSVLKQKRGSQIISNKPTVQASLREMVQEFSMYPNGDFTIRYFQNNSLKGCNSKQDFDEGFNQLDQWIHSQKLHNKQNISDTQPRRQIPNELMKYANGGNKSPRRLSQVKNDMASVQLSQNSHRNVDMKEICREYVQNKKNGRDVGKVAPVWKFAPQNDDYESEAQPQKKTRFFKQNQQVFRQSQDQEEFEEQAKTIQTSKPKQIISSKTTPHPQPQPKGQNILKMVEEIKNNLVPEIEVMAQRIIQERAIGQEEDQELLISQRQSEEQRDQKRLDKARKEIGEYLNMKNGGSGSESNKPEVSLPPVKKTIDETFDRGQQKITASDNQHVGYSFSSDFQAQTTSHQGPHPKSSGSIGRNQEQFMSKNRKETETNLNACNKISLPNIDEVKSERDAMQKVEQYFGQSANVTTVASKPQNNEGSSIDKNYIKEIQSVAYVEPQVEHVEIIRNRKVEVTKNVTKQEKKSLFQQINKTAMSIEGLQENNQVNISVAQGKQSPSNQGSANNRHSSSVPAVQVTNFVSPAPAVKIQFKKIPSPQKLEKREQHSTTINGPQTFETNTTSGYLYRGSTMLEQVQEPSQLYRPPVTSQPNTTTIYTAPTVPLYKNSFSNILQQTQKQQAFTSTSNPSTQPYNYSTTTQQQYQNSRERNNSLKNSNQEEQGRKLKITISPKYHGKEEDKHDSVANVTDFKLGNPKMQESAQGKPNPTPSITYLNTINTTNITYPPVVKSSINKQSFAGTSKFKIDTMFTNVTTNGNTIVTQTRQTHQEGREKQQEHALIRVEKYERVQKVAEPVKISIANPKQSIKSSQQFQFDLDF